MKIQLGKPLILLEELQYPDVEGKRGKRYLQKQASFIKIDIAATSSPQNGRTHRPQKAKIDGERGKGEAVFRR